MHGRPRQKAGLPDPERTKAAAQKVGPSPEPAPPSLAAASLPNIPRPPCIPCPQAALFGQLAKEVLKRRAEQRYDAESLGLAAKLVRSIPRPIPLQLKRSRMMRRNEGLACPLRLFFAVWTQVEMHPEVYTVWNYRREALQPVSRAMPGLHLEQRGACALRSLSISPAQI